MICPACLRDQPDIELFAYRDGSLGELCGECRLVAEQLGHMGKAWQDMQRREAERC